MIIRARTLTGPPTPSRSSTACCASASHANPSRRAHGREFGMRPNATARVRAGLGRSTISDAGEAYTARRSPP